MDRDQYTDTLTVAVECIYTMNVVSFEFEKKIKFLYSMNYELANLIENSVILQKEKTTEKNRTQLYFHL